MPPTGLKHIDLDQTGLMDLNEKLAGPIAISRLGDAPPTCRAATASSKADRPSGRWLVGSKPKLFRFMADHEEFPVTEGVLHIV